jgi:hypothetical protein
MCDDCPFQDSGAGLHLRHSLGKGRWEQIKRSLLNGKTFECHKTTRATGNGTNLYCAGALYFQAANGIDTPYMKMCRAFEGCRESKQELFRRLKTIFKRRP